MSFDEFWDLTFGQVLELSKAAQALRREDQEFEMSMNPFIKRRPGAATPHRRIARRV